MQSSAGVRRFDFRAGVCYTVIKDISLGEGGKGHGRLLWDPDPVSRHVTGGGVRVLSEEDAQRRGAARPDRLCRGRDGGGERVEPADPGHRAVGGAEPVVVFPGGAGVLGRHFVFAGAGPHHPASAREKRAGRGAEEPPAANDDDDAGRDAPQHPGGHGGRRGVRGISVRTGADHGGGRAGAALPSRTSRRARSSPCRCARRG